MGSLVPGSRPAFASILDCCVAGQARAELGLVSASGECRFALAACSCFESGAFKGTAVVLTDITDTKRLEAKALRLSALYATLSAVNQANVHMDGPDSLFRDCCRAAVEKGGFCLAWVGQIDPETQSVAVVAAHGETAYLDGIRISVRSEAEGLGPTGTAVREGRYYICNDFLGSPVTRPCFCATGSSAALPSRPSSTRAGKQPWAP